MTGLRLPTTIARYLTPGILGPPRRVGGLFLHAGARYGYAELRRALRG
jgi:hypothetical protein